MLVQISQACVRRIDTQSPPSSVLLLSRGGDLLLSKFSLASLLKKHFSCSFAVVLAINSKQTNVILKRKFCRKGENLRSFDLNIRSRNRKGMGKIDKAITDRGTGMRWQKFLMRQPQSRSGSRLRMKPVS